ncbi:hypothetical protein V4B17_05965 [Bartonella sp. B23]
MKIFQKIALYIVTIAFFFSHVLESSAYSLNNHSHGYGFTSMISEEDEVVRAINTVMDHISTQNIEQGVIKVGIFAALGPALWGLAAYLVYLFSRKHNPSRKPNERSFDAFAYSAWALV